jgi:hypothetical protein
MFWELGSNSLDFWNLRTILEEVGIKGLVLFNSNSLYPKKPNLVKEGLIEE